MIRTAALKVGKVAYWLLDFALPPRCAGCGTIVSDDRSAIHGRRVILVDDVLTTGSTRERLCARVAARRRGTGRADQLGTRGAPFAVDALISDE